MASNYYLINRETKERIHIGKASLGWQFCFRVNKEYDSNMVSLFKYIMNNPKLEIWCDYGKTTYHDLRRVIEGHVFGDNFKTFHKKHPELPNYTEDADFLADDGSWWCNVDFD